LGIVTGYTKGAVRNLTIINKPASKTVLIVANSKSSPVSVTAIANISASINVNDAFSLPTKVGALMSDKSYIEAYVGGTYFMGRKAIDL
jgi:hypothetical protein